MEKEDSIKSRSSGGGNSSQTKQEARKSKRISQPAPATDETQPIETKRKSEGQRKSEAAASIASGGGGSGEGDEIKQEDDQVSSSAVTAATRKTLVARKTEMNNPVFRFTNPDVLPSLPSSKGSDETEQTQPRKLSESSSKNGKSKKQKQSIPFVPPIGEEGESESESGEHFGETDMESRPVVEETSHSRTDKLKIPDEEAILREKSRNTILRERWAALSSEVRRTFDDPCRVYKLRGYHSEPNLTIPFNQKFHVKVDTSGDLMRVREKFVSCEDIIFPTAKENPNLVRGVLSEIKLRSYAIDEKMKNSWRELFELEKKRFCFFDELFAMGHVVDSLEVIGAPPKGEDGKPVTQGEYFVEAEERHYRKKVDYGRVVFKTKHVYTGNFSDWYFQGPGRYSWLDGTVYQGNFLHGLMHGPGSIHWPDGCVYEGHFINGIRTGWGVYSTGDGFTFAGEWVKGLPHGHGKMWYDPEDDDNDYYEGQWEKGYPQGVGTRQYATGDRYVGNWGLGMRNGYGIMIWLQERQVYKGEWLDGVPHGSGKHIWYLERTPTNSFPTRHVYQGEWVSGRREGIGKMIYPCGSVYEGRWKNGQRHGKGMFINPAGDILIGLFRAGSILGGSDVPLHAPTYECDFGGLTEWLTAKFSLSLNEGTAEEESLLEITKQYLPYIRKLYHRAGEYSQKYGNHGLYPAYMKKGHAATRSQRHNNLETNHREYSRLNEPEHMKGRLEKPESLDGVNPVTRFGLWLLMRDCDSLLDEVTMAYYDKTWCETPPLSFQTRHNPFEPVYLWQFLQCLIVAAVAYYVDIPRLRRIEDQKEHAVLEDTAVTEATLKSGVSAAERRRSYYAKHHRSAAPANKHKLASSELIISNKKVGKKRKPSQPEGEEKRQSKKHQTGDPNKLNVDGSSVMGNNEKKRSIGHSQATTTVDNEPKPRNKSKAASTVVNNETATETTNGSNAPPNTARNSNKSKKLNKDTEEEGLSSEQEAEDRLTSRKSVIFSSGKLVEEAEEVVQEGLSQMAAISVSECFETFLTEKLLPCLKREAGSNLPVVPQPLPALVDIFDAFKGIKNRDIIKGTELLRSTLPHLLFPNPKDIIWWHRSPEPLSHAVDLEELLEMFREKFPDVEGGGETSFMNEFLGDHAQNSKTTLKLLSMCKEGLNAAEVTHQAEAEPTEHAAEDIGEVDALEGEAEPTISNTETLIRASESDEALTTAQGSDYITEGHPFAEEELAPEPFLWADDYKCIPAQRKYQQFHNISTHDVFYVLQQLYPRLCTGGHEKELHFDLIFCDWLWCTSLLAKLSTEREFQDAWKVKPSEVRPITNPQSLGVYAHYVKQIKNNPYLAPNSNQTTYKNKDQDEDEEDLNQLNRNFSSVATNLTASRSRKSILKNAPTNNDMMT